MSMKFIRENRGIKIENNSLESLKQFIQNKINIFKEYENYINKSKWFDLLDEIFASIDDECDNATFDFNGLENIIHDIDKAKKLAILYYEIGYVLGNIVFGSFDEPNNRIVCMQDGFDGAVVPRNMLEYGYCELINHKRNNDFSPAYGANFVFASIIEEELKTHIKRFYAIKYLKELKTKISNNEVSLCTEEDELFDYLCCTYEIESQRRFTKEYDSIYSTGTKQFELLNKYTSISQYNGINQLFERTVTLNQLRAANYFDQIVDDRFTKLLLYLFGISNLNLRNNLAHSNLDYIDYHNIGFTCVLFLITQFIANEFFYKN